MTRVRRWLRSAIGAVGRQLSDSSDAVRRREVDIMSLIGVRAAVSHHRARSCAARRTSTVAIDFLNNSLITNGKPRRVANYRRIQLIARRPLPRLGQDPTTRVPTAWTSPLVSLWHLVAFIFGSLRANPRRRGKPLKRDLAGYWSARRGDSRVIYRLDEDTKTLHVYLVAHRAHAYRQRPS